jgi:signal transduction histidine kinase/CheY-like chemotaxis protein
MTITDRLQALAATQGFAGAAPGPVQLNLPFDEPLHSSAEQWQQLQGVPMAVATEAGPTPADPDLPRAPQLDPDRGGVVIAGPWRGLPQHWPGHVAALGRWRSLEAQARAIEEFARSQKLAEQAAAASEAANRAKSTFLATVSHEIRTPLNGVIGLAQVLAKTPLSPQQAEMLELIQSSGRTLQALLSDILDLARVESGRLELAHEPFHLGRAVREAAQLHKTSAAAKGLQFFVEIDDQTDRWILGDVVRIKQILTNLVSNAVKFTQTGFVSLTVAPGPDRDGAPTLRFSIEDTGIGFDSKTRERLFSRFEQADGAITRRFGGSGLGLAISRQLAEMMGGYLDCESEPGGGSAFILTIPFISAEAPAAVPGPALEPPSDEPIVVRVLLADDHPINRKLVEMILSGANTELTSVENGAEAVRACHDRDFDIILMDMQMPVMDGLSATREIRLNEAAMGLGRTPIVMLTANALADHIAAAEAAGADRHLAKPFDAAELLELIATLPRAAAVSEAA